MLQMSLTSVLSLWLGCLPSSYRLLRAPMMAGSHPEDPGQALPGQLASILIAPVEPLPSIVYISLWGTNQGMGIFQGQL